MEKSYLDYYLKLFDWIKKEEFVGYDPYDGCNTNYLFLRRNQFIRLFLTYFHKFSPINFRKLFRIDKRTNYKSLALINLALDRGYGGEDKTSIIKKNINKIISGSLIEKHGYHCWNGNNMYIQSTTEYQTSQTPGIIGTIFCGYAILNYYKNYEKSDYLKNILFSAKQYLLDNLLTKHNGSFFFRYKPITPGHNLTFNASLKAAGFIAEVNKYFGVDDCDEIIHSCFDLVVSFQKNDGSWNMGINFKTDQQKKQIDFHQGYVLDSLLRYLEIYGRDDRIVESYKKGLNFYYKNQFLTNGQGIYRYPKKWPVNIHNQAQGMITFSKAESNNHNYKRFAETIAKWTINNMLDSSGYFYYLKYPFITYKIPFIRWGQAWMLYALSYLIPTND
jgi:hypothetical protein